MARSKGVLVLLAGLMISMTLALQTGITAEAGSKNYLDDLNGGVAAILDSGSAKATAAINATAKELNLDLTAEKEEESSLVMANVKDAVNVRSEASEDSEKVGKLYKDCGGTILERKDGWTKLQSGNIIGWAKDEYLLFDEDAKSLANDVGKMIATVDSDTVRVRTAPSTEAETSGLLPKGEIADVISGADEEWICIDYDGTDGYVSSEFVTVDFQIDAGETMEEIQVREAEEKAAKQEAMRHQNYGEFTTDADTTMLLAALIQCEAGGESYEGKLAVASVVMNRVRSGAYPSSIHGVIYASGQFTPAQNGKVNKVYESGKINQGCIQAAQEAISGVSNVGDLTHFRRNNGRDGLVIGNHVFY